MGSSRKRVLRQRKKSKSQSVGGGRGKYHKEAKMNKHMGSKFDDFLREEGIYEEVNARTLKWIVATLLVEAMEKEGLTKPEMARRMGTSRSQLDRVLDPTYVTIQLDTLMKAARAVGQNVRVEFEPIPSGATPGQKPEPSLRRGAASVRKNGASVQKGAASARKGAVGSRVGARTGVGVGRG
jgi:antitoxin HicB